MRVGKKPLLGVPLEAIFEPSAKKVEFEFEVRCGAM